MTSTIRPYLLGVFLEDAGLDQSLASDDDLLSASTRSAVWTRRSRCSFANSALPARRWDRRALSLSQRIDLPCLESHDMSVDKSHVILYTGVPGRA